MSTGLRHELKFHVGLVLCQLCSHLTKTTVLYTLKGTKALMTFLQSTNVATRQWILRGSRENSSDEDVGNNGWHGERVGWGRLAEIDGET